MHNKDDMEVARQRREYDALAKSLLAHKEVIANILKYSVKEFFDSSIDEIISCLNGEPEIGNDPVDDDFLPKMDSAGSEAVSVNDGIRSFDIKFKVRIPKLEEEAELIINIESQHNYHPGYTLEKRGIYYLSRMISSQYNVEFTKSNFDDIKKVYSIWICTHSPLEVANTITAYSFKPQNIVGQVPDCPKKYDLMSLVMINLGETRDNYSGLIKMLDMLLNKLAEDMQNTLSVLEDEFKLPLKNKNREVDNMCNLSMGIYEKGISAGILQGRQEGLQEGRQKGLQEGRQEGLQEGRQKGLQEGRQKGLQEGRQKGLQEGRQKGLQEGRQKGLQEGRQKGLQEGKQKGLQEGKIQNAIEVVKSLLEENFTLDDALRLAHIDKETYETYSNVNE